MCAGEARSSFVNILAVALVRNLGQRSGEKRTLEALGLNYKTIEITFNRSRRKEMIQRSNRTTVPQIFIDGYHIGGSGDLEAAKKNGLLDKVLAGEHES